jgi:hypothetical protein
MSKSDITLEQAQVVVDRVAKELGLLVKETSGFLKVEGPTNKHRVYIQRSRTLNRIDFTVDLPTDDPMYKQLGAPNGSVRCHVLPSLENLERALRMLGDSSLETQVPNKPRPFAASKAPVRRPKPIEQPVPEAALIPVIDGERLSLEARLHRIHERAREARIKRILENPDQFGAKTRQEAEDIVDKKSQRDEDVAADLAEADKNAGDAYLEGILAETGLEVSQ